MSNSDMYILDSKFHTLEDLVLYFTSNDKKKEHLTNGALQSVITNISEILSLSEIMKSSNRSIWYKYQYNYVFTKIKQLLYKLYKFEVFLKANVINNILDGCYGDVESREAELDGLIKAYSEFDNKIYVSLNNPLLKGVYNDITTILEVSNGDIAKHRQKAKVLLNRTIGTIKSIDVYITNELSLNDEIYSDENRDDVESKIDSFEVIFERYQHNRRKNDFANLNVEKGLVYFLSCIYFVYPYMTITERLYVKEQLIVIINSCYDLDYKKTNESIKTSIDMRNIEYNNPKEIIEFFNQNIIKNGSEYDFGDDSVNRVIYKIINVFNFVEPLTDFEEGYSYISKNLKASIKELVFND